jgi:hypothetical protein
MNNFIGPGKSETELCKAGSMDMNRLINNLFLIVWRHHYGKEKGY